MSVIGIHRLLTANIPIDEIWYKIREYTQEDFIEYFAHPTLVKDISVARIASLGLGNSYLLRTTHYDKIFEWVTHISSKTEFMFDIHYTSILVILHNIEETTIFTYSILRVLIVIFLRFLNDTKKRVLKLIENCIVNMYKIDIYDLITTKLAESKKIIFHSHDDTNIIVELLLAYTVTPIDSNLILFLNNNNFTVLNPERFI